MPLSHDIDAATGTVRIAASGRVTMPEMVAAVDRVAEDPRFGSGFAVVLDLRKADYTAELEDGNAFVAALRRREADFQGRFALLVPERLHVLATLFCLLADTAGVDRMKCFRDEAEAELWCGAKG